MPDIIVTTSNPCSNGDHRDVTATVDGVSVTERLHNDELNEPMTADERRAFLLGACKVLRRSGTPIHEFSGRIVKGDDSSVRIYDLIAPGSAITKTNIGTAYSNILPGANGVRVLVDFTGMTQFRIVLSANLVGTGQWGARLVRDSDDAVLFEAANLGVAGERELDTDWQALPAQASGLTLVRIQGKSQTAQDDPIFRRCSLFVRAA